MPHTCRSCRRVPKCRAGYSQVVRQPAGPAGASLSATYLQVLFRHAQPLGFLSFEGGAGERGGRRCRRGKTLSFSCSGRAELFQHTSAYVSRGQHTSAYVSIRDVCTSAYQQTSAYLRHTSAYVSVCWTCTSASPRLAETRMRP